MTLQKTPNYYRRIVPLDLPPSSGMVYRSGNNMNMVMQPCAIFGTDGFSTEFSSDDVIIVGSSQDNKFVLVGAVTAFRSQTFLLLILKGGRMHSIEIRQPDIMEGDTPEEVVVLEGSDWRDLLVEYAEITKKKMNVPDFDTTKNLTGYCTWYYYYADVTEANLLENLDALDKKRDLGYKADVVQIDDGYQTFQGDWNDQDPSWPTPLEEISRRIQAADMVPGIWTMPFQASTASRVFREHKDWFVKDQNGEPKVAQGWSPPPDDLWATLDTTNPEVQEHLANVFKTFRKWGFKYFKMDGLGFALVDGVRHDPNATAVSAFREGLKAIREAVPDSYLLGCCPPFMPCLGYVDACRISHDTAARGDRIISALNAVISRWWMYDRYFRADPDVVIARQDRALQTIGESRMSILTGIMTGISLTSDNLGTIAPERLKLLAKSADIRMRNVRPHKWEMNQWPQIFTGTVDGAKAVALINHTDDFVEYKFADIGLDENSEAEELLHPMGMRKYTITLEPHDAALLVER